MVALPCGSRSISNTRRFVAASDAARLTLVVVLPTPPFWLVIAMTRCMGQRVQRTQLSLQLVVAAADFHQMPLLIEPRNEEPMHCGQLPAVRQLFKFFFRITSLHREQPPATNAQVSGPFNKCFERTDGACDHA